MGRWGSLGSISLATLTFLVSAILNDRIDGCIPNRALEKAGPWQQKRQWCHLVFEPRGIDGALDLAKAEYWSSGLDGLFCLQANPQRDRQPSF